MLALREQSRGVEMCKARSAAQMLLTVAQPPAAELFNAGVVVKRRKDIV